VVKQDVRQNQSKEGRKKRPGVVCYELRGGFLDNANTQVKKKDKGGRGGGENKNQKGKTEAGTVTTENSLESLQQKRGRTAANINGTRKVEYSVGSRTWNPRKRSVNEHFWEDSITAN